MLPEQRKRTRMTSHPVYHVIQEKRTQFRLERRLLVPAYGRMNKPGHSPFFSSSNIASPKPLPMRLNQIALPR